MSVKIVCDSSANLSALPGIEFEDVPLKILSGDREFVDDHHLDVDMMVDYLKHVRQRSSTSCPNTDEWLSAFEGADEIYAITLTSNLSGTWASCMQAAKVYQKQHPDARVCVVDSLSAGPEMVLLAEKVREMKLQGLSFDEVSAQVEAYKQRTHLLFALESLKNLANNGRVSPAVAKICEVLSIRLVGTASLEGTLQPLEKVRGEKKALAAIVDGMRQRQFAGGKVRIAHCENEKAAGDLAHLIYCHFPFSDITICPCGGLCSFYVEKGGLLVAFES